jgi:hypothetical protein
MISGSQKFHDPFTRYYTLDTINTYDVKSLYIIDLEKASWYQMKPHELLFK